MAASTSPIVVYDKDPNANLDYTIDWRKWLGDDTILTSIWVLPVGISQAGLLMSSTTTTIWVAGGTAGTSYSVYNQITTVGGRVDKRTIKFNAVDR